jgi:hypothetical protein
MGHARAISFGVAASGLSAYENCQALHMDPCAFPVHTRNSVLPWALFAFSVLISDLEAKIPPGHCMQFFHEIFLGAVDDHPGDSATVVPSVPPFPSLRFEK